MQQDSGVHLQRVASEFARQAPTFEKWANRADDRAAERFRAALGAAAQGKLLDVACGPGVVTAALAPGAASIVAFDATEPMLEKARQRCAEAGLTNVAFSHGDAEHLPFADEEFDGVVNRLAIHHFADPQRALDEMFRVLRRGGSAAIVDAISSENARESNLHNAIERLRDPSHVRMLPASVLLAFLTNAGFRDIETASWEMNRELEEWLAIVSDPFRVEPIRTVVRVLAEAGQSAGIGLSVKNGKVVFFHRLCMFRAMKPVSGPSASVPG
jgi:ubiquinone/menaquinone biosynthesis C-methylase UbiE